jgi:leader peptidase (prepilin peptidase)/N-methyltransferase
MKEFIVFIIGSCVGSFLNVVIYRTEKEISIINPPSFCPNCKKKLEWYDNIPILSYIILGGRCRNCLAKIDIQYPVVEFLSGVLTLIFYIKWKNNFVWFISSSLILYLLIIVSVVDFKTMMLSDLFSYLIALIGIVSSFSNPLFEGEIISRLKQSTLGIITGAGVISFLMLAGKMIYKKEAVGEGDIFLMGAIGSFVGSKGVIDVLILSSFLGGVYGVILILLKKLTRYSHIPFGPFIAISSIIKIYTNFSFLNFIL